MLAALCLNAVLAATAPAPLPDRWLLKLAPADLPKLPGAFYSTDWAHAYTPRSLRGAWTEWYAFRRATPAAPARVTVTRQARGFDDDGRAGKVNARAVPLAVHGPLVEFDGALHTAQVVTWRDNTRLARQHHDLVLGCAVEVKPGVWYQAWSPSIKGRPERVYEVKLEFLDDPRTKGSGKVKGWLHTRDADRREGKEVAFDGTFEKPARNPRSVRIAAPGPVGPDGKPGALGFFFHLPDDRTPAVIGGEDLNRPAQLRLWASDTPAPAADPPAPADPPGLVPAPAKK